MRTTHLLTVCTSAATRCQQKGVLKWASLNRSPVLVTEGAWARVGAGAEGGSLYNKVLCRGGQSLFTVRSYVQGRESWDRCTVRSNVFWHHPVKYTIVEHSYGA